MKAKRASIAALFVVLVIVVGIVAEQSAKGTTVSPPNSTTGASSTGSADGAISTSTQVVATSVSSSDGTDGRATTSSSSTSSGSTATATAVDSAAQSKSTSSSASTTMTTTTRSTTGSETKVSSDSTTGSTSTGDSSNSTSLSCSTLVAVNSTEDLTLSAYMPTNITLGDSMCIKVTFENDNQTAISSVAGNITITDSQGKVVFQSTLVPFQAGSVTLVNGSQLTFQYLWNTSLPYKGMTPQPGFYTVQVAVQFYGMQPLTYVGTGDCLNLGANTTTATASTHESTTTTTTTESTVYTNQTSISTNVTDQVCRYPAAINSSEGVTLGTYLPPAVHLGDSMNIMTIVENDNHTIISSVAGNITITDSQGKVVFQSTLVPFQAGSVTLVNGSQLTFQYLWNTAVPYRGVTSKPGVYTATVVTQFYGMQPLTYLKSNVTFVLSPPG
jgi:hypothetical protein